MENQNLLLAQKVSRSEATVELADYWQKRYELILLNNLFVLSEKTTQQILNNQVIDRPSTPFGDLVVLSHLDANQVLDDIRLQSTIETAVRFLDAVLDILNFNEESKFIVNQYRKIGLGFFDITEFLENNVQGSQLDIIDHLGNLISNSSYRASETLAEEKKACINWISISRHLRPKSFELWLKENQDQKINGLALNESYDTDTILETDYHIIPRRNSNLLLLPPDLEWQIWSDRDESSPKTVVTPFIPTPPVINLEQPMADEEVVEQIQSEPALPQNDTLENFELSDTNTQEDLDKSSQPFLDSLSNQVVPLELQPDTNNNEEIINLNQPESDIDMSIFETLPDQELQGKTLLSSDLHPQLEQHQAELLEHTEPEMLETDNLESLEQDIKTNVADTVNDQKYQTIPVWSDEQVVDPNSETDLLEHTEPELLEIHQPEFLQTEINPVSELDLDNTILEPDLDQDTELESMFAIGELVKIVKPNDEYSGQIYQILDYLEAQENEVDRYRLIGGAKDITNILWAETDLELIDLDVLLDELNLVADNEKSLESDLVNDLEAKIKEANQKIESLEINIDNLHSQLQNSATTQSLNQPHNTDKIISDYLTSDDFVELIDLKVNQKIQELNLVPKTNSVTSNQNRTISTLKMMQKYSQK